ncbi:hypothetical protein ACJX0J_029673, partial [Zea mays]
IIVSIVHVYCLLTILCFHETAVTTANVVCYGLFVNIVNMFFSWSAVFIF